MDIFKKGLYHKCRILLREDGLIVNNGVLLLFVVMLTGCNNFRCVSALTQTHQGSAPTNDFTLNSASPNARIRITSSSSVFIVNVEPPPPSIDSLEEEPQAYKVSLQLLAMQLCEPSTAFDGDRLKVIYSDPSSIKSNTWRLNVSYSPNSSISSNDENQELTGIQANQIVLIPEGRWRKSEADLLATLYLDPSIDGTCPEGTFPCSCENFEEESTEPSLSLSAESQLHATRCIPTSLVCNGQPNCGLGCWDEELEPYCSSTSSTSSSSSSNTPTITSCTQPEQTTTTTKPPPLKEGSGAIHSKTTVAILGANAVIMIFTSKLLLS